MRIKRGNLEGCLDWFRDLRVLVDLGYQALIRGQLYRCFYGKTNHWLIFVINSGIIPFR